MTAPLPTLVMVDEFKLWPGVLVDDTETPSAEYVLLAASNFVRDESGDPGLWPDPATCPARVKTLVVEVAAQVWRNPEAATMRTAGPFSEQFVQTVEAGLALSDAQRRVLARYSVRPGLWSQGVTRDDDALPTSLSDLFSGETIPSSPYPADQWLYGSPA